jgi:hypothetical protein
MIMHRGVRLLVVLAAASAIEVPAAASMPPDSTPGAADLLLVVDCLLPGQIRQLGQRTVYIGARRPVRTTARDCQIRGGEYVAYDRADFRSALAAWSPIAEQGDLEAQVIVGEIHERGLGVQPDHAAAARWYRTAAEAGNRRAQINLANLLERGLGVPPDPRSALEWYRRAAGASGPGDLDPGTLGDPRAIDATRAELAAVQERLKALEQDNRRLAEELQAARAEVAPDAAPLPAQDAPRAVPQPAPSDAESHLANVIEILRQQLEERMRALDELADAMQATSIELQEARQGLQLTGAERSRALAHLAELEVDLRRRENETERQRREADELRAALTRVSAQAAEQSAQLEQLQRVVGQRLLAGPELTLVDPEMVATRGISIVPALSLGQLRQIVGRVQAPAGLLSVTVNDTRVETNELGVFRAELPVRAPETPVSIVAIDRQGRRATLDFSLRPAADVPVIAQAVATVRDAAMNAGVDFGNYHALLIGNADYSELPDLDTPLADVTELARVLGTRYGFHTRILRNATRYEILSALNALREQMTPRDNLVIYYAGHGELDEVNQRGHWLPVDAERNSSANWLSTVAITDLLNIIRARQVLLIADSCYAGALTRSSLARLDAATTPEERVHWIRTMSGKRSRTVLTSGGLAPVMDGGGGRHSVFAKALLEVLEAGDDVMEGQRLHREVAARVAYAAAALRFDQVPEYAPIRFAGHEYGDFFLVPRR